MFINNSFRNSLRLNKFLFIFVFLPSVVSSQEAFFGGAVDRSLVSRNQRQSSSNLPDYMPRRSPEWDEMRVQGRFVKIERYPIGSLGFSIGRPPSKSISKQFHPKKRSRTSGFGSIGMF